MKQNAISCSKGNKSVTAVGLWTEELVIPYCIAYEECSVAFLLQNVLNLHVEVCSICENTGVCHVVQCSRSFWTACDVGCAKGF